MFGFKKEPRCPLCGAKMGDRPGVIGYKAIDPETGEPMVFQMDICEKCSDELDEETKDID